MKTGEKIKLFRVFAGMLQEEFARNIGTNQRAIAEFELSKYKPRKEYLQGIIRLLNLSRHWLLNDKPGVNYGAVFEDNINIFVVPDERFIKNKKKINEIAQTIIKLFYEFLKENKVLKIYVTQSKSSTIFIFRTPMAKLLIIKALLPELTNAFYSIIGKLKVEGGNIHLHEIPAPEHIFSNLSNKTTTESIAAVIELFKVETFELTKQDISAAIKTLENRLLTRGATGNELYLSRVKKICKEIQDYNIDIEDIHKLLQPYKN